MMLDLESALEVAEIRLRDLEKSLGETLRWSDRLETKYGWCFFYQSDEYLRTKNISYALTGNSPFLVSKIDGSIVEFGTSYPIEYYVEKYESTITEK